MPTPALDIRAPEPSELPELSALLVAQLREHGNQLPDAALGHAAAGMIAHPQRGRFLLARSVGQAVGFAALSYLWTLERGGRAAWLDELYVVPAQRGQGIGAALLSAALDLAQRAGALAVDLEVETGHERAASLYRRAGFVPLSRARWARELEPLAAQPVTPPSELAGGCFCGAVRYRVNAAPSDVAHCHCGMCRRTSGAPFVSWLTVPRSAFTLSAGAPAELRSSGPALRRFCAACGTALTFQREDAPSWIDVTVGSLDDPAAVTPRRHIWTDSQLSWLHIEDDLPRHPRSGPP